MHPYDCTGFTDKDTAKANAQLMAAAPDLLEVCQNILSCLQNAPERTYERSLLQAVIKKATE